MGLGASDDPKVSFNGGRDLPGREDRPSGEFPAQAVGPRGPGLPRQAVVLAAGRGSRMRRSVSGASSAHLEKLHPKQLQRAREGQKALIPFHGHPFLAHVLSALADGGVEQAVVVVGPGPHPIRSYLERVVTERLTIRMATQEEPLGGAHAMNAAGPALADAPFLVVNGDNFYPPAAVARGLSLRGHGMVAFPTEALVQRGNIPRERVAAFALVARGPDGHLQEVVEKPAPGEMGRFGTDPLVSMTCWHFLPSVFQHLPRLSPSPRGELELPGLVRLLVEAGECVEVVKGEGGVLDLTGVDDVPGVSRALKGRQVRL